MKKIIAILTAAAIFYSIFTPLRLVFDGGRALMILIPTVLIIVFDHLFTRKSFLPVMAYVGVALLLLFMGSEYFTIPTLLQILFAYACFEHYLKTRDEAYAKIVLTALYGSLMLMVFASLPQFIAMPNLSRLMIEAEENRIDNSLLFWTISYPDIHSLPIYSISLFFVVKDKRFNTWFRLFAFVSILTIFVLLIYADSTTALLLNVGIFAAMFLYNPHSKMSSNVLRLIGAGITALIVLNKTVLVGLLSLIQPVFAGSSTYVKIDEMILLLSGQGSSGDLELREDLLNRSINSFMSNPLFPEMDMDKIGSHNVLIDHIVAMGLIPGLTFVWFIIDRIRRPIRYLSSQNKAYYYIAVFAFLTMGFAKNFLLTIPTFAIVPMTLIFLSPHHLNIRK